MDVTRPSKNESMKQIYTSSYVYVLYQCKRCLELQYVTARGGLPPLGPRTCIADGCHGKARPVDGSKVYANGTPIATVAKGRVQQ